MTSVILVALDGSTRARGVFAEALEIGALFHAKLVLFRAVSVPAEFPAAGAGAPIDTLERKLVKDAVDELSAIAARAPNVATTVRVDRSMQPWRAILDASDDVGADLIVLGSHGYHGLDRVLGTTAAKVVNLAKCSALIVRGEH